MTNQSANPAAAYQEYFGPTIFKPLSRHVIELAAPRAGERVLDLACGTGIATRAAAERVGPTGHVAGIDINPAMIKVAQSLPAPAGTAMEWRLGDATATGVQEASFDLVICQQGLQFFPSRDAGAAEMRRALVDGGRAVVAVCHGLEAHPLFAALAEIEEPHLNALGAGLTHDELVAPFSFGDARALHDVLAGAGFSQIEIVNRSIEARFADADTFVARLQFAYAAVIPQFAEDPSTFDSYLDAVSRDGASVVAEHRDGDHVVVPMHANIAVARV